MEQKELNENSHKCVHTIKNIQNVSILKITCRLFDKLNRGHKSKYGLLFEPVFENLTDVDKT